MIIRLHFPDTWFDIIKSNGLDNRREIINKIKEIFRNMDGSKLTATGQINQRNLEGGKLVYQAFQEITKEPIKHQQDFLLKLLADNKDTEYGKKYGFDRITSIKEFQEKLPVTSYDDYAEYIERMTEKGESNLITVYPVNHYNKSSGTVGVPKRIPVSDVAAQTYFRYITSYLQGMIGIQVGKEWVNGKSLSTVESVDVIDILPCGASYGAVSVKAMLAARPYLNMLYTSPDEAVFPPKNISTRYLHARFGLMEEELVQICASFASFSYDLMRYIEKNWKMLVEDIKNGTIHEGVNLDESVRHSLMEKIKPMPERAAQLQEIFEKGFDEPFVPKVWPNLAYTTSVGTGVFENHMKNLKKRYVGEKIPHFYVGLTASEGVFTVPYQMNHPEAVLIPDSVFFEFLPIEAKDDFSKLVTMEQLEQDKIYEVIITNLSGFYRYRMRDAIRVTGMYNATPKVEYLYRLDNTVSLMGEKTSEESIRFAAEETAKELGFELVGFSMYPDDKTAPVRYQYFLEVAGMPADINPKIIRQYLEKNLAKANPSMGDKVKKGICESTRVNFLEPESYSLYMDLMIFKGTAPSQIKPVTVIHNEVQRKFFFAQTEYSSEVMH